MTDNYELKTLSDLLEQRKQQKISWANNPVYVKRLELQIKKLQNKIKELKNDKTHRD